MAGASKQARRLIEELKKQGVDKLPEQLSGEDQELLALDREISPDRARHLQPQVGNNALQNLLRRNGRLDQQGADVEIEVEEEGAEQEVEEAGPEEATLESSFAAALSSSDVGAAGAGYDDQEAEWDLQYGGDGVPDPNPPPAPRRQFRRERTRRLPLRRDAPNEAPEDPAEAEALELPPLARAPDPVGDERVDALWGWITDPAELAGAALEPEDLDPMPPTLARCMSLGRYLSGAARDPLARGLAGLIGPLPGAPGLAATVARASALGTLAVLIEAEEAGVDAANRAATLALEDDAVAHGRRAAHRCVRQSRLAAHYVFEEATRDLPPEEGPPPGKRPRPGRRARGLLSAAIEHVVRPGALPRAPRMPRDEGGDLTSSEQTAHIDALLRALTGQAEPGPPPALDHEALAPMVRGIEELVNAAARAQIEIAAAAIAVERATAATLRRRISSMLQASDRELRAIARAAIGAGRRLEALIPAPLDAARPQLDEAERTLEALREQLALLRESSFEALGAFALVADPPRAEAHP